MLVSQRSPVKPSGQAHRLNTLPLIVRIVQVPPFTQPHSSAGGGVVVAYVSAQIMKMDAYTLIEMKLLPALLC